MAVADLFLRPLGLAALASIVPLILLYFLRPKPVRIDLPTLQFLFDEDETDERNVILRALQRDWLLLVQLLVLLLIALSLASPYVAVAEERVVDERVVVVDASASMAVEHSGSTRFDQAVERAGGSVTDTTSIVVAGPTPTVALARGPGPAARQTLDSLRVSHSPGDLASAIARATAIAGSGVPIVVVSDFVDGSNWRAAVATAEARGHRVELRSVGGSVDNVGIVDRSFEGGSVAVTVENFGDRRATRTVSLGSRSTEIGLGPGDATTVEFPVPDGGGIVQLSPADRYPIDDRLPIAAPPDTSIDVLLLTNDENRFLTTALSLVEPVSLTVREPPVTVSEPYDVIVFSNVDPGKLLPGNIQAAEDTLRRGGGVVIQSQADLAELNYGDLLLLEASGLENGTSVTVADDELTTGISFAPPERYVAGDLRDGRALVTAPDGSPIIATASREEGQLLYYGFVEDASAFKYNYLYPVFWKRAVFQLAGRQPLPALNRETGAQLDLGDTATVDAPDGERSGPIVVLDQVGFYAVGDQRFGAALLDRTESNVTPPTVSSGANGSDDGTRIEDRRVPVALTPFVVGVGLLAALGELVLLRRRGDL